MNCTIENVMKGNNQDNGRELEANGLGTNVSKAIIRRT